MAMAVSTAAGGLQRCRVGRCLGQHALQGMRCMGEHAAQDPLPKDLQFRCVSCADAQTISTMHADFKAATSENTRLAVKCAEQV